MSDPFDERLRSYYRAIQVDPPARLEANVARALQAAHAAPAAHAARTPWRPAVGLLAAGAAVIVVALLISTLRPGFIPSPSPITGGSASASTSASPSASPTSGPSASAQTSAPTPSLIEPPSPSPTASPTPAVTPLHSNGNIVPVGAMSPSLSGPAVNLDGATVLVVGGMTLRSDGMRLKSNLAEIYNLGSHTFRLTGSMADARYGHTATRLADGRVLVVGGADLMDGIDNLATAEIYDPSTGKFTRTGSMAQGRADHTATLLADGRVLIAGGFGGGTLPLATAEIYDPATGRFTSTGPMTVARVNHAATLLAGGSVLITGGLDSDSNVLSSAEIYDPTSQTFHAIASMTTAREWHTATGLNDGRVLIVGGVEGGSHSLGPVTLATAEIYDPSTGKFSATGSMHTARYGHTATALIYGQVVVAGGQGTYSLEVYWPDSGQFGYLRTMLGSSDAAVSLSDRVLFTGNPPELYCSWPASSSPCR